MAEDPRTSQPSTPEVNRARMQGGGVGQREMDMQRDPDRATHATAPDRTEGWDNDPAGGGDAGGEDRSFGSADDGDADGAEAAPAGDLGEGTPANVDIHKLGQEDNPEQDWGEPAGEGVMHSQTNTRRGEKTEAERGQGAKTRAYNKDIISRRT